MSRVLFLTESFHPVLGGGERHIRELAGRLVGRGFEASVVTRRGAADWPAEEQLDGVRVLRVGRPGPSRTGKYAMLPAALGALRRVPFDVLVVRGTRVLGLPGLLAARRLGRPVVLQAEVNGEMSGEVYTWGTPWARAPWRQLVHAAVAARNLLMRRADAFVAMSRAIRDEFVAAGVAPDRVALIPHGVDTVRFRPARGEERAEARRRFGLPQESVVLVYTGRLLRGKGLETLLDAFAGLAVREPRARLWLVGSGAGQALSVEEELKALATTGPLAGRVVFAGRVDDVEACLRASDLFVFPSVFEALGLSLIEAAASGLPCVGSRTGGIVDVIEDGESGLLVPPGDAAALGSALEALVASPQRRSSMGARGRALAEARFDLDASVERYRALFESLAGR